MSKHDDLFGGFFDFNGDGKTSLDEEWIAYKIIEDASKKNKEKNSYSFPKEPRYASHKRAEPIPDDVQLATVSETPDKEQYKKEKKQYRSGVWIALIVCMVMMVFTIVVMYAAIASYDTRNSASGFVVTVFVLAGLVVIGVIIYAAYQSIRMDVLKLRRLKSNYEKTINTNK